MIKTSQKSLELFYGLTFNKTHNRCELPIGFTFSAQDLHVQSAGCWGAAHTCRCRSQHGRPTQSQCSVHWAELILHAEGALTASARWITRTVLLLSSESPWETHNTNVHSLFLRCFSSNAHVGDACWTHPGLRKKLCGLSLSNSSSLSESSEEVEDRSSRRLSSGWKGTLGEKTAGVPGALNTEHDG